MDYPFGPLAPDQSEASAFTQVASNVLPLADGYGPMKGPAVSSGATALATAPKGIRPLVLRNGNWKIFAGTDTDWHELDSDFAFGAGLGGSFALTAGDHWSFEHYGAFLLGTNTTDGLQGYNVETPGGFTTYADAGKPREIFAIANTLVGLDCEDNNGTRDNRLIRNSAINDHTNWKTRGADYQPLEDGGALIVGRKMNNNAAFIGQASAIRIMQFGNAPGGALYSLADAVTGIGPVSARGTVAWGGNCYFPATDGFCRYPFGATDVDRIGAGFIDEWWLGLVDQSRMSCTQAAIDPRNKMVWFRWKRSSGVSDDIFEDLLGYSWHWKKWVMATVQTSYFCQIATPGLGLDDLDVYGTMDTLPISLDDRFFQGGQPVFCILNGDFKFAPMSGNNLAATIRTFTRSNPVSGLVGWATPISDADSITLALGVKDDIADALTWKAAAAKVASGRVPLRGRGLNLAFEASIPAAATWTYAKGIDRVVAARGGPK